MDLSLFYKQKTLNFYGIATAVALMSAVLVAPKTVSADPLERGVQGAIGGAIIGGILDGGKGAGRGAAIGGAIGIIGGAAEEERRREFEDDPIYDRSYDEGAYDEEVRYREPRYEEPRRERRPVVKRSALVSDVQTSLNKLGYNPGPIDGVMGSKTADAIGQYQEEYGLLVTKKPSKALHDHMVGNGG